MKTNAKFITAAVAGILAVILIVLVRTVDVAAIGPAGTEIGLSGVNGAFRDSVAVNMTLYKMTEILGVVAIASGAVFAAVGLVQLIQRRSLFKVDGEILALGGLFVVLGGLYVFFEKVVVNFRPVIMEGETAPEASFPSSHTMLACVIFGGVFMLIGRYVKNRGLPVALRLLSGVHWLTDIIGGVLISVFLLAAFAGVLDLIDKKRGGSERALDKDNG